MKRIKLYGLILMLLAGLSACKDEYFDLAPTSSVSTVTIFESTDNVKMAINGIARLMVSQHLSTQTMCGEGTIKFLFGEYGGENYTRPGLASGWANVMNCNYHENSSSIYNYYAWFYYYMLLGNANTILQNIDNVEGTEAEKNFCKAQALTYRAFCYEQLVQFYCYRWQDSNGGTAVTNLKNGLILRTEENIDETDLPLVSSGEIYRQIYSDLDQAIQLYSSSSSKRSNVWEPNINVAYAVYARAAITRQDYAKAAEMAAKARNGYPLMTNAEYQAGFSAPNQEWIWGSYGGDDQPLYYYGFHSYMSYDGNTTVCRSYPNCISKTLYEKIPATDIRKKMFLDPEEQEYSTSTAIISDKTFAAAVRTAHPTMLTTHNVAAYMNFKFSIDGSRGVGYINHFRSSEMYLIEAEAKYFTGDVAGAQAALNTLTRDSKRDEEYECTATGEDLLAEIKMYRAIELWGEGFDWLDKKRYNEPITRLSFAEGGNFVSGATAVNRTVEHGNRWTCVTPLIERENNKALN